MKTVDEVLYKIGSDINKVYKSNPLIPWCTTHYFKLFKGKCVGCEAKQAIEELMVEAYKKGFADGVIGQLPEQKRAASEELTK